MLDFRALGAGAVLFALVATGSALAAECPGKPDALGTSRTLYVEPSEHIRLGMMQYSETLPLADHEVVLTFDDGPLAPYTTRVLDTLAAECVKATFFLVGRMARANPELVRRIHQAGHTIGTHSENHPFSFHRMSAEQAEREVESGIASVAAALGDRNKVAPFFRIPGLLRGEAVERTLAGKSLMAWSADFPADDWLRISASEIAARALSRIEARRGGMLLLHDIKPATVLALPGLLRELKARGYRIVHVEPASAEHPKTVTRTADWASRKGQAGKGRIPAKTVAWPRPSLTIELLLAEPVLPSPDPLNFGLGLAAVTHSAIALPDQPRYASAHDQVPLPPDPLWPPVAAEDATTTIAHASEPVLPVPGPSSFGIGKDALPVMSAVVAAGRRHAAASPAPRPQRGAAEKRSAARPAAAAPRPPGTAETPPQPADTTSAVRPRRTARRHVAEAGLLDFLFSPKPPSPR